MSEQSINLKLIVVEDEILDLANNLQKQDKEITDGVVIVAMARAVKKIMHANYNKDIPEQAEELNVLLDTFGRMFPRSCIDIDPRGVSMEGVRKTIEGLINLVGDGNGEHPTVLAAKSTLEMVFKQENRIVH